MDLADILFLNAVRFTFFRRHFLLYLFTAPVLFCFVVNLRHVSYDPTFCQ